MLASLAIVAVLLSACGDAPASKPGIDIVATTTILGDVAAQVAGDSATVTVLLPRNADPHEYQASAMQVAEMAGADLVIANGLHLEGGLLDVLTAAESDGTNVLWVGEGVDPLPFGNGTGTLDPHIWLDPIRMAEAARLIAAELHAIDPAGGWDERAETYASELLATDAQITAILASVPEANRKLVTSHEAFGYFAARYGFQVIGTVIPGGSTLAEPSSAELAGLVDIIRREGVPAIFTEATASTVLVDALARELGGAVTVVPLYTGSLGEPGSGADTLIGLLITNAQRVAEALS